MGALEKFLARHERVGADTMVFIYHLEDHPAYASLTQPLFEAWEEGKSSGVTSVITILEILVKPKREGKREAARDYLELLITYPNLTIVEVDLGLADLAADLRAKYGIRMPDALQLAAALQAGAGGFITNDGRLKQVTELEVAVLDELLAA
ncbi:MAG: type II toxin-antitoxin system VapC family toxin [Candidatus Bipolaricaulia bacterium]